MSAAAVRETQATTDVQDTYHAYGAIAQLFRMAQDPASMPSHVSIKGPAGTGKTRGVGEFLNWTANEWPGCRLLMVRKTRRSLTESGMVTLERKVLNDAQGVHWQTSQQRYLYPNGSIIGVAGMDKPSKVMSSEWDVIYGLEANELTEADCDACKTRLRNNVTPFQVLITDRNPDAPNHWLRQREQTGAAKLLLSHHEDNPTLWDRAKGAWTPEGAAYISKLDELTGVRYLRLRLGIDAAAEGIVYDEWDPATHLIKRFPTKIGDQDNPRGDPPREWPRYISIDFGYTNPTAILWFAVDPDGRLYLYRELYMTKRTVDEHAAKVKAVSANNPLPRAVIADPEDADGRAVFSRVTGWSTLAAHKDVENGIQAVKARLRSAGDGKPRLFILQDSLIERDADLANRKLPTCLAEEVESYVWATNAAGIKEVPVDANNHSLDACRYMVAYLDLARRDIQHGYIPW